MTDSGTWSFTITFLILYIALNANWGSFEAYLNFEEILMTGLIGAFFDTYFPITGLRASN